MALNIAVTSKFDPFTQEDYIKPLANYWKEYEKYEDLLLSERTKLAALDPSLSYFDKNNKEDQALKAQYDKYKQALETASDDIAKGLTRQTKTSIRELFPRYQSEIVPLQEAFQKKAAAISAYQKQLENNPDLMSSSVNPLNMSVSSFYGANNGAPGYFIEKGDRVKEGIKQQASTYSESITTSVKDKVGDKEVTRTVTGSVIPDIQVGNERIEFINSDDLTPEVMNKVRKMYEDAKIKYRYDELDKDSQNTFNVSFIQGIQNGWTHKKTTVENSADDQYTQVYGDSAAYILTKEDGTTMNLPAWISKNGTVKYLYEGRLYYKDQLDKMQAKIRKEQAELDTLAQGFESSVDKKYMDNLNKITTTYINDYKNKDKITLNEARDDGGEFMDAFMKGKSVQQGQTKESAAFDAFVDDLRQQNFDTWTMTGALKTYIVPAEYVNTIDTNSQNNSLWIGYDDSDYKFAAYKPDDVWSKLNNRAFGTISRNDKTKIDAEVYGKLIVAFAKQRGGETDEAIKNQISAYVKDAKTNISDRFKGNAYATKKIDDFFKEVLDNANKYASGNSTSSSSTYEGKTKFPIGQKQDK